MVEELVRFSKSRRFSVWPQLIRSQARLAVNSVTLGDYTRPMQIGNFVKELFAGFQLLNLKNDILRKRSDGIKYSVCRNHCNVYSSPKISNLCGTTGQEGGGCGLRSVPTESGP
jgi:hypothetical protein